MKIITLSNGIPCFVDDEDYPLLSRYVWYMHQNRAGNKYALVTSNVFNNKYVLMHRLIMHPKHNQVVDHIDGNGLNNCKNNLRNCRSQDNNHWRAFKSKSGYRGVSQKDKSRYYAYIQGTEKRENLGFFETAKDAALAYDRRAEQIYGKYAKLNFPNSKEHPYRPRCPHGVLLPKIKCTRTNKCNKCKLVWSKETYKRWRERGGYRKWNKGKLERRVKS